MSHSVSGPIPQASDRMRIVVHRMISEDRGVMKVCGEAVFK